MADHFKSFRRVRDPDQDKDDEERLERMSGLNLMSKRPQNLKTKDSRHVLRKASTVHTISLERASKHNIVRNISQYFDGLDEVDEPIAEDPVVMVEEPVANTSSPQELSSGDIDITIRSPSGTSSPSTPSTTSLSRGRRTLKERVAEQHNPPSKLETSRPLERGLTARLGMKFEDIKTPDELKSWRRQLRALQPSLFEHDVPPTPASTPPVPRHDSSAASTMMDAQCHNNRTIRWKKGKLIGRGTFGSVFLGLDLDTLEFMAVKQIGIVVPRSSDTEKAENVRVKMQETLEKEVALLQGLDHPNIVRYLGFQVDGAWLNLFLEYVDGGTVASLIESLGGPLPEDFIRSIVYQILLGLEYIHAHYIVHRDIKGANILITEEGIAKIADFGISRRSDIPYKHNARMTNMTGSVFWMAPEVVEGKGYSAKVDIWSLACTMIEMYTGQLPWGSNPDEAQTIYNLGHKAIPQLPSNACPEALDLMKQCLTLDEESRPTATELLNHPFFGVVDDAEEKHES
ncbi:hypothetical protein SmJEL517_g01941 [Synchytrium microbalum]|uniref:Protein kinase domain-containing protein n=1 Tax=Synchytrium microbalum TaxID=1806994 RepID=A0A507CCA6_9FUNG|nr:uncharacterized protein SmJEL517_g01941 [Synchytrium microbalum]TPX35656.1 hypothetical protein SmJEL517_g01941 [Synchytrium microbalum]